MQIELYKDSNSRIGKHVNGALWLWKDVKRIKKNKIGILITNLKEHITTLRWRNAANLLFNTIFHVNFILHNGVVVHNSLATWTEGQEFKCRLIPVAGRCQLGK